MKKDPLNIIMSLIFNLNLLEENEIYNINEFKLLKDLEHHWLTIKKYIQIINIIQKYCPKIEIIENTKLKIKISPMYNSLNKKEKLILYLFNKKALDQNNAVHIPINFKISSITESVGYLYEKTEEDKYYLTKSGLNLYKSLKNSISDLIFNEKEIEQVFFETEFYKPLNEDETTQLI